MKHSTVGVLLGFMLIQPSDFQDFQTHLALLMDEFDIRMPELPGLELSMLNFSAVEMEWQRIWSNIPEPWKLATDGLEFTVGEKVAAEGLSAKHPVILIPGIISTVSNLRASKTRHSLPLLSPGFGIMVNISRVPALLPQEGVGKSLHDLPGHFQP